MYLPHPRGEGEKVAADSVNQVVELVMLVAKHSEKNAEVKCFINLSVLFSVSGINVAMPTDRRTPEFGLHALRMHPPWVDDSFFDTDGMRLN